jgi:TonB-dependent SusC/RagA subfamily outer membrane receptor
MKSILFYLIQVIICSGLLYGYYHLFLRNNKFHTYNRFYLLAATVASILIPFINIPLYFNQANEKTSVLYQTLTVISAADPESVAFAPNQDMNYTSFFTWENLLWAFYILIAVLVFTRFLVALFKINYLLRNNNVEKLDSIRFINTQEPGTPFSFFRWLFWNNKIKLQSTEGQQVFRHELFHIQQKHSWDIVFMELLTVVFWLNPFFHLIKKEIKAIHEFLADEFAVRDSEHWSYAELLLMQALGTQTNRLTNPFFHNQIKRRIAMITSSKNPTYQYLRKVMILPIAVIVFVLFAFKIKTKENNTIPSNIDQKMTVIINAGHGGKDNGAMVNNTNEKDIVLAIAKKIKDLNRNSNINILLTRNDDSYTPVKEIAEFADNNKADLLISLHVNSLPKDANPQKKGIEVYVSSKKSGDYKSEVLANALINELQNTYDIDRYVLKSKSGIWVLDSPKCPAALIEIGYLSDPDDFKFIVNEQNQEKVAQDILDAISKYAEVRAEGLIEEQKTMNFGNDISTGKKIATYGGIIIQDISVFGPTDQLVIHLYDGSFHMISEEKSEELKNKYSSEMKYLFKAGEDTIKPKTRFYLDSKTKSMTGYYEGNKVKQIIVHKAATDVTLVLENGSKINLTKEEAEKYGILPPPPPPPIAPINAPSKNDSDPQISTQGSADNSPLIIVDGIEQIGLKANQLDSKISADRIESINVLKDGAAIALYGQRAQNGVIQITTKKDVRSQDSERYNSATKKEASSTDSRREPNIEFTKVEIEPAFPGGEATFKAYVSKYLREHPNETDGISANSTVEVQFIVDIEGRISDVSVLGSRGNLKERLLAEKIIRQGPKWIPGLQNGKSVKAMKKQIVEFVIER